MIVEAPIDKNVAAEIPGSSAARRADLQVVRVGTRSVVSRAFAESPLKLLTPKNHGSAAWVYTSTYGGGLVDGDTLALRVHVAKGAEAVLSTQASTKVYRSPHGTRFDLTAQIDDDGTLTSIPDPVVCFARARYAQRQSFDLAPDANLVHVDWLSCGRRARGERWAFDECRTSLRVRRAGQLRCFDALTLSSTDGPLVDRLGRFEAIATVVVTGPRFKPMAEALVMRSAALPMTRQADQLFVASPLLGGDGCLVRLAGVSLEDTGRAIRHMLDFLPPALGDDPWARKW